MTNRRIMREELDDYTKVMGVYDAAADVYNGHIDAAKSGTPYLYRNEHGAYNITDGQAEGSLRLKAGDGHGNLLEYTEGRNPNTIAGMLYSQVRLNNNGTGTVYAPESLYSKYLEGPTYKILPDAPAAPDVKAPSFTQKQIRDFKNPTPTTAEQARSDRSRVTGESAADWRPTGDTSKGILQRIMEGKA